MHACLISHGQIIRISNLKLSILFCSFFLSIFPSKINNSPRVSCIVYCDKRNEWVWIRIKYECYCILIIIISYGIREILFSLDTLELRRHSVSFSLFLPFPSLFYYRRLLIRPMHALNIRLANFIWFFLPTARHYLSASLLSFYVRRRVGESCRGEWTRLRSVWTPETRW